MGREMKGRGVGLAALAWLLVSPAVAFGQGFQGRVTEEGSTAPVEAAEILLVDQDGRVVATGVSNALGEFGVAFPEPGEYSLRISASGYLPLRLQPAALRRGQVITVDFELAVNPIPLEGVEVTVDAFSRVRQELMDRGVRMEDMGRRFIPSVEIERRQGVRDVGAIIESVGVPGSRLIRPENVSGSGLDRYLCLAQNRGRKMGKDYCSLVVLDGAIIPLELAADLDPNTVRAMAILTPTEATLVYGTAGGSGALLIFTKDGR